MKIRFHAILLVALTAFLARSFAEGTFYVLPGAKGTNDGLSWANAYAQIPTKLQRGAVYYLGDGTYAKQMLATENEGEKTITIKKATAADHGTDMGWKETFGDGIAEFPGITIDSDWWIVDGGVPKDRTYGIKIFNGEDKALIVTINGRASHVTLRGLELAGDPALVNRSAGVYAVHGPSHLLIQLCYIHDFYGVPFHLIDAANVTIEQSKIARNKSTPEWHSEGVQARGCSGLIIRNNLWEDMNGTAVIVSGSGQSSGWSIHGNIFNGGNVGHGIVADNMVDSIEDVTISGNIITGHRGNAGMNFHKARGRVTVVDNVWYDNSWISFTGLTVRDYNFYSKCRFPLAFQGASHESALQDGKDGKYAVQTDSPFADFASKNFALSSEAIKTITHQKQ